MAGSPPEHHVDRMGYCLGNCTGAVVLALENFEVTRGLRPGARIGSKNRYPMGGALLRAPHSHRILRCYDGLAGDPDKPRADLHVEYFQRATSVRR